MGIDKGIGTGSVRNAVGTLSRTTFYKWLKRYQKDGLKGLLDRPKGVSLREGVSIPYRYKQNAWKWVLNRTFEKF
ncbi:MAG: helix-turn-helix domain-containing protein [Hydrogenobaculum sp.]